MLQCTMRGQDTHDGAAFVACLHTASSVCQDQRVPLEKACAGVTFVSVLASFVPGPARAFAVRPAVARGGGWVTLVRFKLPVS